MHGITDFDIVILGGGPAGSAAALRLLSMGHKVALIELQVFPRGQIGESLSPGVRDIFNYLDAGQLLKDERYFTDLSSSVIWESQAIQTISSDERGPGLMVNRALMDMELLRLAQGRGLHLVQPARVQSCKREGGFWHVQIISEGRSQMMKAIFVLDARGRRGALLKNKILTAPDTIAVWTQVNTDTIQHQTTVEAVEDGWLWGGPVADNKFRVMAFTDAASLQAKAPADLLKKLASGSRLFNSVVSCISDQDIQTCKVDSYCHDTPWGDNYIRLGETAFTLDPLSSTGVEKAMRVSLQAAIAINTILCGGDSEMAKTFYEDRLMESIVTHMQWTADYYKKAWPVANHPFWKSRSENTIIESKNKTTFLERLTEHVRAIPQNREHKPPESINVRQALESLWHQPVKISPQLKFVKTVCIINDRLELKTALMHPFLEREMAYVDHVELEPLFGMLAIGDTFGDLMYKWGRVLPFQNAARICAKLNTLEILVT